MSALVDEGLPASVAADALANGRTLREEGDYQRSVGLLNDRALAAVRTLADAQDRAAAAAERAEREEAEAEAEAARAGASWNPRSRTWDLPAQELDREDEERSR